MTAARTTSRSPASARKRRGARHRVMSDLVINHTADNARLLHERPDLFVRDSEGKPVSPAAIDPDDPQAHGLGRPDRTRLPFRACAERADAHLRRLHRETPKARRARLPLRCRLQGAAGGLARPDPIRQGARARDPVRRRDAGLHLRGGAGDGGCGLRLPVQLLRVVEPQGALGPGAVRAPAGGGALHRLPENHDMARLAADIPGGPDAVAPGSRRATRSPPSSPRAC